MDRLETLIRDLDPVRGLAIPEADLSVARRIRFSAEPTARPAVAGAAHRFAIRIGALATSAVAAIVVLAVTLLPGGPGTAPVGASQQLDKLATVAAAQPSLSTNQWAYRKVLEPLWVAHGNGFTAYFQGTVETWTAADGSGRSVVTIDPTPRFYTTADQAAWVNAGSPPPGAGLPASPVTTTFGPGSARLGSPPSDLVPVLNVSGLPTDPLTLRTELQNGTTGIPAIDDLGPSTANSPSSGDTCATPSCTVFARALALLRGPTTGTSPALQAGILQALAGVPGVQALGTVSQSGQSGSGFAIQSVLPGRLQSCPDGTSVAVPPVTTALQMIVNPQSGALVATQNNVSPLNVPTCRLPGQAANAPATTSLLSSWSVVEQTGVVGSSTALPGGSAT